MIYERLARHDGTSALGVPAEMEGTRVEHAFWTSMSSEAETLRMSRRCASRNELA